MSEFTKMEVIINTNFSNYGISKETIDRCRANEVTEDFFNREAAIKSDIPIITQSRLSAMSLIEIGYEALAVEDFDKVPDFISMAKKTDNKSDKCYVLMLNENGEALKEQDFIKKEFEENGITYIAVTGDKDSTSINDRYRQDKTELKNAISKITEAAKKKIVKAKKTRGNNKPICASDLMSGLINLKEDTKKKVLTGLKEFDRITGGLGAGIHIIGGSSAVGKTSLVNQIADEAAKQGKYVLFFELEMFIKDLYAKSISRTMYRQNGLKEIKTKNGKRLLAKEYGKLFNPIARKEFTDEENKALVKACETYNAEYGDRVLYYDRNTAINREPIKVEGIKDIVADFAEKHSNEDFVVILDYLQLLANRYGNKMDERKAIDHCLAGLKDIAYGYEVPVIVISSLNRNSYDEGISMNSYKGSGEIDYDADMIFGLQLDGMDITAEDKNENARKVRIAKLKKDADEAKKSPENDVILQLKMLKKKDGYNFDTRLKAKLAFGYFDTVDDKDRNEADKTTAKTAKAAPKTEKRTVQARTRKNTKQIEIIEQNEDGPFAF